MDLVQLLHSCADDLWEDAQAQGARVQRRCAPDLALVMGDERLLRRAVLNLGWNALRHGPAGGVVTMSLELIDGAYLLAVHDQGEGFAQVEFAALSERYASGQAAAKGHGLGLALVRLVAEKHAAQVVIAHPTGGGFRIGLQLHALQGL